MSISKRISKEIQQNDILIKMPFYFKLVYSVSVMKLIRKKEHFMLSDWFLRSFCNLLNGFIHTVGFKCICVNRKY